MNGVFLKKHLTLGAHQVCREQPKQWRSVSFHRSPADASLQKQRLVAIPLTNNPTSRKRTLMSAKSTSSADDETTFLPDSVVKRCMGSLLMVLSVGINTDRIYTSHCRE